MLKSTKLGLLALVVLLGISPVIFQACTSSTSKEPTSTPVTNSIPPVLSDTLITDCKQFSERVGPRVGDNAIDFTLKDTDGISVTLSELLRAKPVLMVFGSYT